MVGGETAGRVSGFISNAPVSHIFGAITGLTAYGSTMGWVVGVGDTYLAGICWWIVFRIGHASELSMQTGGKACGSSGGGTSSQMG